MAANRTLDQLNHRVTMPSDPATLESVSSRSTPRPERVLVVVVNYRTASLVKDCLQSLVDERQQLPEMSVVVTDNASGDDSVSVLGAIIAQPEFRAWVTFQPLDTNGGFASGNNAAIRPALDAKEPPDLVLLLNPDTWIRAGAIVRLVEFLADHPEVGLAGSRLEDPDGTPQRSAFRFPTFAGELDATLRWGLVSRLLRRQVIAPPITDRAGPTDWVAGASLMVRREVFEAIGLLDEQYFMYYEEVDFCRRAAEAGWSCWYVPESRVVHLVGQASGVTNLKQTPRRRPAYWFESRRHFFLTHYGAAYTAGCDASFMLAHVLWRCRRFVQRKPDPDPPRLLWDFFRQSVFCRGFSQK